MATYYVRSSGGDNGNAGTSFGAAWATIAYAIANASAADEIRICADGTHATTATLDFSSRTDCHWVGANGSDGTVDGTVATIQATATWGGGELAMMGSGQNSAFGFLDFDANDLADNAMTCINGLCCYGCTFRKATSHGVDRNGGSTNKLTFAYCKFLDNGGAGIRATGANVYRCLAEGNTNRGFYLSTSGIWESIARDNGGSGFDLRFGMCAANCVADNNDAEGFLMYDGSPIAANCVATRNGLYGFEGGASYGNLALVNCMSGTGDYANTSGHSNNVVDEINAITNADPLFVDADGGDYTPGASSPLIDAGLALPYYWHGGTAWEAGAIPQHT